MQFLAGHDPTPDGRSAFWTVAVGAPELRRQLHYGVRRGGLVGASSSTTFEGGELMLIMRVGDANVPLLIDSPQAIEVVIPFRANAASLGIARVTPLWRRLFHYYNLERDAFLERYHKRSNVGSALSMMNRKFGDAPRSKTQVAQFNEALCTVPAHNICCLIQSVHELPPVPPLTFPAFVAKRVISTQAERAAGRSTSSEGSPIAFSAVYGDGFVDGDSVCRDAGDSLYG